MWMNTVSQFRDKVLRMHADQTVEHFVEVNRTLLSARQHWVIHTSLLSNDPNNLFILSSSSIIGQAFTVNHIKCHLTSKALDSYKMNKGNRVWQHHSMRNVSFLLLLAHRLLYFVVTIVCDETTSHLLRIPFLSVTVLSRRSDEPNACSAGAHSE